MYTLKHIIYTAQTTGFEDIPNTAYANPEFFSRARRDAKRVTVMGDWPAVVEAYERAGVPVEVVSDKPKLKAPESAPAEPRSVPSEEEIEEMTWGELRKLANSLSDEAVVNKDQALEVIRRARTAQTAQTAQS